MADGSEIRRHLLPNTLGAGIHQSSNLNAFDFDLFAMAFEIFGTATIEEGILRVVLNGIPIRLSVGCDSEGQANHYQIEPLENREKNDAALSTALAAAEKLLDHLATHGEPILEKTRWESASNGGLLDVFKRKPRLQLARTRIIIGYRDCIR